MAWPPWPKGNEKALASYVLPNVAGRIRLAVGCDDLLRLGMRREVLQAIYGALLKCGIRYAREPFDPTPEQQLIRTPEVILRGAGDATCLDLALLFAGLCLGNDLLPLVVVLNGHALVAVSLVRGRRDAGDHGRVNDDQDGPWVRDGLLKSADTLRELVARGDYLPIECTGFARSDNLPLAVPEGDGRVDGCMTFERAVDAGREQLCPGGREFAFAIDVALLQDVLRVPPHDPAVPPQSETDRDVAVQIVQDTNKTYFYVPDECRNARPHRVDGPTLGYHVCRIELVIEARGTVLHRAKASYYNAASGGWEPLQPIEQACVASPDLRATAGYVRDFRKANLEHSRKLLSDRRLDGAMTVVLPFYGATSYPLELGGMNSYTAIVLLTLYMNTSCVKLLCDVPQWGSLDERVAIRKVGVFESDVKAESLQWTKSLLAHYNDYDRKSIAQLFVA